MKRKIRDFFRFYRFFGKGHKVGWVRCLGYPFFAYALSGNFSFFRMLANTLSLCGAFMASYSLNDYYDHRILCEENKIFRSKSSLFFCLLPLLLFPLVFFTNVLSASLSVAYLFLMLSYSAPPLRLKERFGSLTSTLVAGLGFLESYFVTGTGVRVALVMAVLVALFHLFIENVHLLSDCECGSGRRRLSFVKRLRATIYSSIMLSLVLSFFNRIFLISVFFSALRLFSLARVTSFTEERKRVFSPFYSIYEFLFYALLSTTTSPFFPL